MSTNNAQVYSGRALKFDKSKHQRIEIPNFTSSYEGTMVARVSKTLSGYIFGKQDGSLDRLYMRIESTGELQLGFGKTMSIRTKILLDEVSSYLIVLVWGDNKWKIIVNDGEYTASGTYLGTTEQIGDMKIGTHIVHPKPLEGMLSSFYMFKRQLSDKEVSSVYLSPEKFYLKSLEDTACVINMPLIETGSTVYNEMEKPKVKYSNSKFTDTDGWTNAYDGLLNPEVIDSSLSIKMTRTSVEGLSKKITGLTIGQTYTLKIKIRSSSDAETWVRMGKDKGGGPQAPSWNFHEGIIVGIDPVDVTWTFKATEYIRYIVYKTITKNVTLYIDSVSLTEEESGYKIINYTTAMNQTSIDEGLQTIAFEQKEEGRLGAINGYANFNGGEFLKTNYVIDYEETKTIEYIIEERTGDQSTAANILSSEDGYALFSRLNANSNKLVTNLNNYGHTEVTIDKVAHIAIVVTPTGYELYHNGVGQGVRSESGGKFVSELFIGSTGTAPFLKARLRMFKVHKKKMTPQEVQRRYELLTETKLLT